MYHINRYEVLMQATSGATTATFAAVANNLLFWSPQFVTHLVRAYAINLNATPGDAGIVLLDKRPTYSSGTGQVTLATINLATSHTFTAGTQARVVYKDGLALLVQPGEELVINVTDASAGVTAARVSLWVEAVYETPANVVAGTGPLPSMTLTT